MTELLAALMFGALAYVYFVYPALLYVLAQLFGRRPAARADYEPTVTLLIAAHNEQAVIEEKIRNCLALDYPKDKLEVVIASDGSDDGTNSIVRSYAGRGITLLEYCRVGKIKALKQTVPLTRGEVIVFSDANTMYQPDALRRLVGPLADEDVGAATGDVRLVNADVTMGKPEGLYYKYERFLQKCESALGAVIGVDGAMYAVKRAAFVPPSDRSSCDDFVIGMNVLRGGRRVVYAPDAVAYEDATTTVRQEFRRRVRYTGSALQANLGGEGVPRYFQATLWWMYLSHKVLRWFAPFFLIGLLVCNALCLGDEVFWDVAFALQCGFYLLAAGGLLFACRALPFFIRVPFYFTLQNVGSFLGVGRAVMRGQAAAWRSPDRTKVAVEAAADGGARGEPTPASHAGA
jgi:cellulose synthase/poly-beta-1,6-N-acetylglucosamine synthase-like glycosyltransferase